ncbi:MAG: hypothetical protein ACK5L3_06000 [Oscillospiraceae bacterium]
MRLSHVIYKVKNLEEAVRHYTEQGYRVEYGSAKTPTMRLFIFLRGRILS